LKLVMVRPLEIPSRLEHRTDLQRGGGPKVPDGPLRAQPYIVAPLGSGLSSAARPIVADRRLDCPNETVRAVGFVNQAAFAMMGRRNVEGVRAEKDDGNAALRQGIRKREDQLVMQVHVEQGAIDPIVAQAVEPLAQAVGGADHPAACHFNDGGDVDGGERFVFDHEDGATVQIVCVHHAHAGIWDDRGTNTTLKGKFPGA